MPNMGINTENWTIGSHSPIGHWREWICTVNQTTNGGITIPSRQRLEKRYHFTDLPVDITSIPIVHHTQEYRLIFELAWKVTLIPNGKWREPTMIIHVVKWPSNQLRSRTTVRYGISRCGLEQKQKNNDIGWFFSYDRQKIISLALDSREKTQSKCFTWIIWLRTFQDRTSWIQTGSLSLSL